MKRLSLFFVFLTIGCVFCFSACEDIEVDTGGDDDSSCNPDISSSCNPGETQTCYCSDGAVEQQTCNEDGSAWSSCGCDSYSIWCDDVTGLCWQDPQKDAFAEENPGVTSFDAIRYCEDLEIGGYNDWRVPTITELRSIIEGNSPTHSDGQCYVEEGSNMNNLSLTKLANNVIYCMGKPKPLTGPDESGCFWKTELSGTCNRIDPASTTHYLEFWSSTPAADDPDNWISYVFFDTASVGFNHALSFGEVRCVRDGPSPQVYCEQEAEQDCTPGETKQCTSDDGKPGSQVCKESGNCFSPCESTGFTPSPPPVDVCSQCDQVKVKINIKEELDKQPYMLAAFLYKSGELFIRPPDVGIDENEIRYPDISPDKPIEIIIPGCSYYRDRCMAGDYYLVVYLKMNEGKFPGMPDLEDYVWVNFKKITLTGDGSQNFEFDITAAPIIHSPCYMLFDWIWH